MCKYGFTVCISVIIIIFLHLVLFQENVKDISDSLYVLSIFIFIFVCHS